MLSQPATKLFFKTTEPRAAKWISDAIGEIEVERLKESRSMRLLGSRKSYAMEIATKPLVMASEISGLEPIARFHQAGKQGCSRSLSVRKEARRTIGVHRAQVAGDCAQTVTADACSPAQSNPRRKQQSRPRSLFSMRPADKPKEAFVWDESKGIE